MRLGAYLGCIGWLVSLTACGNSHPPSDTFSIDGGHRDGGGEPRCGNGTVENGEACDDENRNAGDGCSADCRLEACGNGTIDNGEECDDANGMNGDGCDNSCFFSCHSGSDCVDADLCNGVEACDSTTHACVNPGNLPDGTPCRQDHVCRAGACAPTSCGNGSREGAEQCDDGNTQMGDGCDNDCTYSCNTDNDCSDGYVCNGTERCHGITHVCQNSPPPPSGTACDRDNNTATRDVCLSMTCLPSICGDGFADPGREECDDNNLVNGDGCDNDCTYSCKSNAECLDAEACNGTELCDLNSHVCVRGTPLSDGTACGNGKTCSAGACTCPFRRRKLTFANSAQPSNLNDFPVLVVLDNSRINYGATRPAGQDLRFVDADGTTRLAHEIESWQSGGTSYVWVKVPRIDGGSTSDFIWMYYGDPAAQDSQNPTAVWSSNYVAVWHLSEAVTDEQTAGTHRDSTSRQLHGKQNYNDDGEGIIARGQVFDGTSDLISVTDPGGGWDFGQGGLDAGTGNFTLSAWVKVSPSVSYNYPSIIRKGGGSSTSAGYWFHWEKGDDTVDLRISDGTNRSIFDSNPSGLSDHEWHHVTVVLTRTPTLDTAAFYVDGRTAGSESLATIAGNSASGSANFGIGIQPGDTSGWYGNLDEVTVANTARSADWIAAQYKSTTDAFVMFGAEESGVCLP